MYHYHDQRDKEIKNTHDSSVDGSSRDVQIFETKCNNKWVVFVRKIRVDVVLSYVRKRSGTERGNRGRGDECEDSWVFDTSIRFERGALALRRDDEFII